jgi:hypothetical protein
MKRILLMVVALFVAYATAEAQGLGQLYDNGQVRGIVVKLAPDGQPAVLMSIESAKEAMIDNKNFSGPLPAFDRNDGRVNMAAIGQYQAQHGGSFPLYEWCCSLGAGWYIPAINEVYDAWVVTFGGGEQLDNYDQDRFLAVNDLVKSLGGEKMNGSMNNYPLGMLSSTLTEVDGKKGNSYVVLYVELRESAGSAVGNALIPKGLGIRTRKGGKISTLYMPVHMSGGIIAATHAFYRLREDAYAGGIYEAPMPNAKAFGNTGREADTRLISVDGGTAPQPQATPAPQPQYVPQAAPAPAPAPHPQYVPQPAPQPAPQQYQQPVPQTAPAQQPVVYANNSGWDIIVAPGQDIQCRVLRVSEKEIEYKKAGFENGPTYTISRKKAEKIIYSNGMVEEVKTSVLDFIKKK